jgi:hypothetical protein
MDAFQLCNQPEPQIRQVLIEKRKAMKNCSAEAELATTQKQSRNVRQGYQSVQTQVNANSCAFPSLLRDWLNLLPNLLPRHAFIGEVGENLTERRIPCAPLFALSYRCAKDCEQNVKCADQR